MFDVRSSSSPSRDLRDNATRSSALLGPLLPWTTFFDEVLDRRTGDAIIEANVGGGEASCICAGSLALANGRVLDALVGLLVLARG